MTTVNEQFVSVLDKLIAALEVLPGEYHYLFTPVTKELDVLKELVVTPRDTTIAPLRDLRQLVKEYYDEDWEVFSWEWGFYKDIIQIQNMQIDGVSLIDFVGGEYTEEHLLHEFYNEVDYWTLYIKGIREVRRNE